MSRLIIVGGAGGAGKSYFLRKWSSLDENASRISKFVSDSRAPRESEIISGESDLIFHEKYDPKRDTGKKWYNDNYPNLDLPQDLGFHSKCYQINQTERIESKDCIYEYHGSFYEVDIKSIDCALKEGKTPIVIVRKAETIMNLLKKYSNALVIYVQSIISGKYLIDRLMALGESEEDAIKREGRNNEDLKDYINNIQQLPKGVRVVLNDFDDKESGNVVKQIIDIYNEEIKDYKFKNKSIFVVQSYKDFKDSLENFEMVQSAARECFGNDYEDCYRACDREDGSYDISPHVWDSIDNSDCIICDITNDRCDDCQRTIETSGITSNLNIAQGVSANVWLELGYTIKAIKERGFNVENRLILICNVANSKNQTILPIDVGGTSIKVIQYSTQAGLKARIKEQLNNIYKKDSSR